MRCAVVLTLVVLTALAAESLRDRAMQHYRDRQFAQASALLEEHVRKAPGDHAALLVLGLSRQLNGEREAAEAVFRKAVAAKPSDAAARFYLARVEFLRGRLNDAERDALHAAKLGHPPAAVHHLVGLIRVEQERSTDALAEFDAAIAADAGFAPAAVSAAEVLITLGRPGDAVHRLDGVTGSAEALYHRARARLALGDRPRAEADLAEAVRMGSRPEAERLLRQLRAGGVRIAPPSKAPLAPPRAVRFDDVARQAGLSFVLRQSPTSRKHLVETMPGGLAVFDYDNDGLLDVFFANGAALPSLSKRNDEYSNRLFRNLGGMRFADVTGKTGLNGAGYSIGAAAADYDNDGRTDLFVTSVGRSTLYRNTGNGFAEVTREAGIKDEIWPVASIWFDFDNDGLLDLFVVNYLRWSTADDKYCGAQEAKFRVYCDPRGFEGLPNRLYRNRGDGTFEDVSASSGIASHTGKGMSGVAFDYDSDGDQDVFVTNDTVPNFLFRNEGNGKFTEVGLEAGVALKDDGNAISSMGVAVGDANGDGLPDIAVTALSGEWFPLFENQGGGYFRDATAASGMAVASAPMAGWGVAFADLNNDGATDLFTANSHVTDNIDWFSHYQYRQANGIFLNRGAGRFEDARRQAGAAFQLRKPHRGAVVADLDGDGWLDAIVTVLGEPVELWRNRGGTGAWLAIRLRGQRSNRDAIGARVCVDGQCQWMSSSVGYASSSLAPLHFGLAGRTHAGTVEVRWPSGGVQVMRDMPASRVLDIVELSQAR